MFMLLLRPLLPPAWYRLLQRLLVPCSRRLSWCLWLQHSLCCRLHLLLFLPTLLLLVGLNCGGLFEPAMLRIIRMTCILSILLLSHLCMTSFWLLHGATSSLRSLSLPCGSPHLNSLLQLLLLVLHRLLSLAFAALRVTVTSSSVFP